MNNCAALLGTLAGREFIQATADLRIRLFGLELVNKQYILLLTALLMVGVVFAVQALHRKSLRMEAA